MPAGHEPAENTHLKMAKALKLKAFAGWVVETRRIECPLESRISTGFL